MGAEPLMVFMDEDPKTVTVFAHFDREQDRYYLGPEALGIKLRDGRSWAKRGDVPDSLETT